MVQAVVSDHLGLTFWMVAYERFNCICFAFDSWTADCGLYNKGVMYQPHGSMSRSGPGRVLSYKNDKGAHRKFSKETLRGIMSTLPF